MVCLWVHPDAKRSYEKNADLGHFITACLRRAGEILPDKTTSGEIYENSKFSQLMKNKAVHLLAFFLMVYIGVEVTIGGIIFSSPTIQFSKV